MALLGCSGADLVLPQEGQAADLAVAGGDSQSGQVGSVLGQPLVVRVTDASGRPVADQRVAFTPQSGGKVSPDTALTDTSGTARATWTLGPGAGAQSVRAEVVGSGGSLAVTFHATAGAGSGARLEQAGGDGQTATAGSPLPDSLVVRAFDQDGNPAAGVEIRWSAANGGTVSPAVDTTGSDGLAATRWTLGGSAGSQTASAAADGLAGSPVGFTATATVGSAGQLVILDQPSSSGESGKALSKQPRLALRDANGNAVHQAGVAVSAAIVSGPAGSLSGNATVATDQDGIAKFTDLAIVGPQGTYRLGFSGAGLSGVTSQDIRIGAGSAAALAITTQPSSTATAGEKFDRQPQVQLVDAAGNHAARGGVAVTVTIASGGGTLLGTTTVQTDGNGLAKFTDLAIDGSSGSRTLIFAAAGYASVTSDPIQVTAAAPPPPQPPTAQNDSYDLLENTTLDQPAPGVLANDDGNGQQLTAQLVSGPQHGTLSLHSDGGFSYHPAQDYNGTDQFSYRAVAGGLESPTATVTLSITPVNGAPSFSKGHDLKVNRRDGPESFPRWASNIDDGDPEVAQILTFHLSPEHPALFRSGPSIDAGTGTLTFTPSGQKGKSKVAVVLTDNGGTANGGDDASNPQTFTITFD